ncbi:MAG: methyltransferase domain-containing protein, partial [Gammaproteobacteria bacterium]|nr:methyltransferase domain-containing protein [Gammaproteobacteria bacterium]
MNFKVLLTCAALALAACGQQASEPTVAASTAAAPATSIYAAAVANPDRPAADLESDARRHPAEILEFFGVDPGDAVLEMFAGGGYYTELLARVVGENGTVVAHVNTPILGFAGDAFEARHAGNRLANVSILHAENNELALEPSRFDVVTMTLNYHDLYWVSAERGWTKFDVPAFLAEIYKGLKPGGTLGITDHQAAAGS